MRVHNIGLKGLLLVRRTAIVVFAALAIHTVGGKSLAVVFRFKSPETALRFDPRNAEALAARAEQVLLTGNQGDRVIAQKIAGAAVQHDATTVAAVTTLGLIAAAEDKGTLAARRFAYAQSLSRRNLPTQLWFIDRAVAANDVSGALYHYDIALRTSELAPAILFPVLKTALADSEFVVPISRILARQPNWASVFIRELADSGPDLANTAALFVALRRHGAPVGRYEDVMLQQRLGDAGDFQSAWNIYQGTHPEADRAALRDGNFRTVAADASIFEWRLDAASTTGAISVSSADRNRLRFDAVDTSGVVVRQTLLLKPGKYQLDGAISDYQPSAHGNADVRMICHASQTIASRIMLPRTATGSRHFSGPLIVGVACPVQELQLFVESNGNEPLSGAIGSLTLRRLDPNSPQ